MTAVPSLVKPIYPPRQLGAAEPRQTPALGSTSSPSAPDHAGPRQPHDIRPQGGAITPQVALKEPKARAMGLAERCSKATSDRPVEVPEAGAEIARKIQVLEKELADVCAAYARLPDAGYPALRPGYAIFVDRKTILVIERVMSDTVMVRKRGTDRTDRIRIKEIYRHLDPSQDPSQKGGARWSVRTGPFKTAKRVPPRGTALVNRGHELLRRLGELQFTNLLRQDPLLGKFMSLRSGLLRRRQELLAQIRSTQSALQAWRDERDGWLSVPSRFVAASFKHAIPLLTPGLASVKPLPHSVAWDDYVHDSSDPEAWRPAPDRERLAVLEARLDLVDRAIDNLNRGRPMDEGIPAGKDYAIDFLAEFAKSDATEPNTFTQLARTLDFAAKAAAADRAEDTILACYAAARDYLTLENEQGESLMKKVDGSPSLTSQVNLAIQKDVIDNAQKPVLTAADLGALLAKTVRAWPNLLGVDPENTWPGRPSYAHQGLVALGERPGVEEIREEIQRLKRIENGASHRQWRERLRQEGKTLADVHAVLNALSSPTATQRIKEFLSAALDLVDSSEFLGMLLVGAATGSTGAALMGKSWTGVGPLAVALSSGRLTPKAVGLYLATSAGHGMAFHAGMNLFSSAIGETDHVDWSAMAFARSVVTFALLHAATARHMVKSERLGKLTANRQSLNTMILWAGRHLEEAVLHSGAQIGALSAVPLAEAALRRGDVQHSLEILRHNFLLLLATQAVHTIHLRNHRSVAARSRVVIDFEQRYRKADARARLEPTVENAEAARQAFLEYTEAWHRLTDLGQVRLLLESGETVFETRAYWLPPEVWRSLKASTVARMRQSNQPSEHAVAEILKRTDGVLTLPKYGTTYLDATLWGTAKGRQLERRALLHLAIRTLRPEAWQKIVEASRSVPGLKEELTAKYGRAVPKRLQLDEALAWGLTQPRAQLSQPMLTLLEHPAVAWLREAMPRSWGEPFVLRNPVMSPPVAEVGELNANASSGGSGRPARKD